MVSKKPQKTETHTPQIDEKNAENGEKYEAGRMSFRKKLRLLGFESPERGKRKSGREGSGDEHRSGWTLALIDKDLEPARKLISINELICSNGTRSEEMVTLSGEDEELETAEEERGQSPENERRNQRPWDDGREEGIH